MEINKGNQDVLIKHISVFATTLLVKEKRSSIEVVNILINTGIDAHTANSIVENIQSQIEDSNKGKGFRDIVYGTMWFIGGIIGTITGFGLMFWGAILLGSIQFMKGLFKIYQLNQLKIN